MDARKSAPKVFVRDATGLVKEFGTIELVIMASYTTFALIYATLQFPFFYGFSPGSSLAVATAIAGIPFLLLQVIYWAMSVILPRSGSDYVWVARIFHPAVAFTWSMLWMLSIFGVAFVGAVSAFGYGISTSLTIWGLLYQASSATGLGTWFGTPIGSFTLGAVIIIAFGLLGLAGTKGIKGLLYLGAIGGAVGTFVIWGILASTTPAALSAKWDSVLSQYVTYNGILQVASKSGWAPQAVTFAGTLIGVPLATLFLLGGNFSNVVSGEIKNVRRAVPIAFLSSLVFGILFWAVFDVVTLHATGYNWMSAVGYLYDNNATAYNNAIPYPPTETMVVSLAAFPGQALTFLVLATYLVGSLPSLFLFFWIPSRYFFAWSFDRIIPSKLSEVGSRFRTPHYSIAIMTALGLVILALYYFTTWPQAITLGIFIMIVSLIVPALAVMVFPFKRKNLLDNAPDFMKRKIGSLPVVSLLGLLTAIAFGYVGYLALINPLITSPTTFAIEYTVGIIVVSLAIYYASVAYHKRKGIDIELALREIPPE